MTDMSKYGASDGLVVFYSEANRHVSARDLYWVCLSVFSCTVLFVGISQVIGCEDRLRNDLYCVEWGVKLYSNQPARNADTPSLTA